MDRIKFGAFVMTCERPVILRNTVEKLLAQTFPPQIILVIDNGTNFRAGKEMSELGSEKIHILEMETNIGPAGAANIGLQKLTQAGYDWIYWGDDDNPPRNEFVFEIYFRKIQTLEKEIALGIFGGKGGKFHKYTGRIRSLSNRELTEDKEQVKEVDVVPGGHTMLVNSQVVKAGVLPSEKLFFGFEELDFCLKVKSKGYHIFIDSEEWIKIRTETGKTNINYRWRSRSFGNSAFLSREYYSVRNLLFILYSNNMIVALIYNILKSVGKSLAGFRFGKAYGCANFRIQWLGIRDFLIGKYGKKNDLNFNVPV